MRFLSFTSAVMNVADIGAAFYLDRDFVKHLVADLLLNANIGIVRQNDQYSSSSGVLQRQLPFSCRDYALSDNLFDGDEDVPHMAILPICVLLEPCNWEPNVRSGSSRKSRSVKFGIPRTNSASGFDHLTENADPWLRLLRDRTQFFHALEATHPCRAVVEAFLWGAQEKTIVTY